MQANIDGKVIDYDEETIFRVQIGRWSKGSYRTHYTSVGNLSTAWIQFQGINIGRGYKKRLVMDGWALPRCGRVLARCSS